MLYFIKLIDRDQVGSFEFGVESTMSLDDLHENILELFNSDGLRRRVVGVYDDKMKVFYPLSFLLRNPRTFATRENDYFTVVYEDSTFMNEVGHSYSNSRVQNSLYEKEDDDDDEGGQYVSETSTEADVVQPPRSLMEKMLAKLPVEFIDAHLKMLIDEVSSRTMLKKHSISQIFHSLSLYGDTSDNISADAFLLSIDYLDMLDPSIPDGITSSGYDVYERIYEAVRECSLDVNNMDDEMDDDNDQTVSVYRLCLFMSLFCSFGSNEKDIETSLKIMYNLFDFNRDGFVTLNDAHNCFHVLITSLMRLFPDMIFEIDGYPVEKVVNALTESLFNGRTLAGGGNTILQYVYFQQWYKSRDNIVFLLVEANPNPFVLKGMKIDYTSFQEARGDLGLEGIYPDTLMKCLSHYASERSRYEMGNTILSESSDESDEFQFISRRGVFTAVLLASKMESANNIFSADWEGLHKAELIISQVFSLFDISNAGYVDKNDIFSGLSVFCGGTFDHRVQTMFAYTGNSQPQRIVHVPEERSLIQTLVTRGQMIEYLLAVLKPVLLFGEYDLDDDLLQSLAVRMINDALSQKLLTTQVNGGVATIDFALWLQRIIRIEGSGIGDETGDGEHLSSMSHNDALSPQSLSDYSSPENSVPDELNAVKSMMGFTGFTAEDVMDLLGEMSREGMITEQNWYQAVNNMCAFNSNSPDEEDDRKDEAYLFAQKVFDSIANLYPEVLSDSNERLVNYSLLLSAVTILCDSPVEDKLFTAFSVLSDTSVETLDEKDEIRDVQSFASVSNVTDYFRGVFAIIRAVSPAVQNMSGKMGLTCDDMAAATLQCAMAQNNMTEFPVKGFNMDEFSALAWTCMEM